MRQQRPTALVLAVSLAIFANAALAQRVSTGGVRAGAASATANVPAVNAGNTSAQGSSSPNVVTTTSGGNMIAVGVPVNGTQGSNTASGTNPSPNITQGQTSGVANLQSRLIDANGNLLVDANGNALVSDGRNVIGVAPIAAGFDAPVIGVDPSQVVVTGAALSPTYTAVATATPELDRATRKELAKSRTASRTNKQLLTSIAPRTNVDRTDQMPDDPIPLRY